MLSLVLLTAFISGMFVHDYPEWLKDIFNIIVSKKLVVVVAYKDIRKNKKYKLIKFYLL